MSFSTLKLLLLISVVHASPPFPWSWDRLYTWNFPGCDPSDGTCTPLRYDRAQISKFVQFDLVLFQGQNYTRYANGSWVASEEAESDLAGQNIKAVDGNAPTFPYIQWSMPQAWYEAQARFNDPEERWKTMWLQDSKGKYLDAHDSGAQGLDEGGDYTQYSWRRLYDWRQASARDYFVQSVLKFVLESPHLNGAFFDDVNAIATFCIPGTAGIPGATGGKCGNWTSADANHFLNSTVQTVEAVLQAFHAKGKVPLLSIRQDGTTNPALRSFQAAVNPMIERYGGIRFMEALCQVQCGASPCTLDGRPANESECCKSQVDELVTEAAAGLPRAVHGWGACYASKDDDPLGREDFARCSNTTRALHIAAFLIGAGPHSYFSYSGSTPDIQAAGGDGSMWRTTR